MCVFRLKVLFKHLVLFKLQIEKRQDRNCDKVKFQFIHAFEFEQCREKCEIYIATLQFLARTVLY